MEATIYHTTDHAEFIQRAANTMLEGRWPATSKDWQLVFNWIGLNLEGEDHEARRIATAIWVVYRPPVDAAYVMAIIDHQREERRRMGIGAREQ